MKRTQAEKRVRELHTQIRHHDYLYYVKDGPEISDEVIPPHSAWPAQHSTSFPRCNTPLRC
jgi:NAD-dependent DNA ligase